MKSTPVKTIYYTLIACASFFAVGYAATKTEGIIQVLAGLIAIGLFIVLCGSIAAFFFGIIYNTADAFEKNKNSNNSKTLID